MKVQSGCCNCIREQAEKLARSAGTCMAERERLIAEFNGFYLKNREQFTPPEMAAYFYLRYGEETGNFDPYREEKQRSTELAKQLMKELAGQVDRAEDKLAAAVRIVSSSNIIDYGVLPDLQLEHAAKAIDNALAAPVDMAAVEALRERLNRAENVLYILDNCGEAVLDKLLIEQIPGKVTLGVRGRPILNDVTRNELEESGLSGYPVIDTGDGAPGVSLRGSSPEFLAAMAKSDLIIAKGQGNFESLEEEFTAAPVFFLFRVKCRVISEFFGLPMDTLQIIGRNMR